MSTGVVTPAIESFREQQVTVPMVTPEAFSSTRCPAEPAKNTNVFWPGTEPAKTVTGDPPTDIDAEASGGTS